ncbi:ATP12 family chaperone protein [Humitalea sp. 24SJ18S-53]|uniref:ATP12 family chaperone protein n=1 Tax=Humitalea sp. 24SJ18S-53 TaxID=3422307 RepID=UPI003D6763A4
MKRFWTKVEVTSIPGGYGLTLDGRPMRLPGGGALTVQGAAMAAGVAAEWQGVTGEFTWDSLPLTRLVGTAQDRIAPDPAPVVDALAVYGETDLLCYRAEDPRLAARQAATWDPLLDWAADTLGARLRVTQGVMPVAQDPVALAALHAAVARQDAWSLAALGILVPSLGSLVLALALVEGRLSVTEALAAARIDEAFQQDFWGVDAEADARAEAVAADVALAAHLFALSREA